MKNKKKQMIIGGSILAILIIVIIIICLLTLSKELKLSEFEEIAIYGYLEDYLSLDKLYLLSGNSSYDDLQYTQSKIKQILDSHYSQSPENTISTTTISSELENQYGISSDSIDYHGILISDYEFLPQENAFRRVEGANHGMANTENQIQIDANSNEKLSVTKIEKISKDSYKVYFDVVDSWSDNQVSHSGNVTIKVTDKTYELENCSFEH